MKIHKFEDFKTSAIHESFEDDEKNYVTDVNIKNEEQLVSRVKQHVAEAFDVFVKKFKLPIKNPTFNIYERNGSTFLNMSCDKFNPFENDEILKHCVKSTRLTFFGSKEIRGREFGTDRIFKFIPHIWTELYFEMESIVGGDQSFKYIIGVDSKNNFISSRADIFYNILQNKWESYAEHWADELGYEANDKLVKTNSKTGVFEEQ